MWRYTHCICGFKGFHKLINLFIWSLSYTVLKKKISIHYSITEVGGNRAVPRGKPTIIRKMLQDLPTYGQRGKPPIKGNSAKICVSGDKLACPFKWDLLHMVVYLHADVQTSKSSVYLGHDILTLNLLQLGQCFTFRVVGCGQLLTKTLPFLCKGR